MAVIFFFYKHVLDFVRISIAQAHVTVFQSNDRYIRANILQSIKTIWSVSDYLD